MSIEFGLNSEFFEQVYKEFKYEKKKFFPDNRFYYPEKFFEIPIKEIVSSDDFHQLIKFFKTLDSLNSSSGTSPCLVGLDTESFLWQGETKGKRYKKFLILIHTNLIT